MEGAIFSLSGVLGLVLALYGTWSMFQANPVAGEDPEGYLAIERGEAIAKLLSQQRAAWTFILVGFAFQLVGALGAMAVSVSSRVAESTEPVPEQVLSIDEMLRLEGTGNVLYRGNSASAYHATVYNGNLNITVTGLEMEITAMGGGQSVSRTYRSGVTIPPMSASEVVVEMVPAAAGATYLWAIRNGWGRAPH